MTAFASRPAIQMEQFLHPGEFHFGSAPSRIGTLLGSCVSITVWHPVHHVGGMCHILLPGRQRHPGAPPDGRYADEAVELFAIELKNRHIAPTSCQVKLFGGGNMFSGTAASGMDVGRRNIDATRNALGKLGLTVIAEHVGGTTRRRLSLDLATGHVWMTGPGRESDPRR